MLLQAVKGACLYQLDSILEGCRLVETMSKGFTNQRAG
jgi:hypothetical protein